MLLFKNIFNEKGVCFPTFILFLQVAQLRTERAIDVANGRVQVLVENFDRVSIPAKMTGITMGLIDRMQTHHQLITKVEMTLFWTIIFIF